MYLVHINPYYLFHSPCVQQDPELEKLYLLYTAKIIHLLFQIIKCRCSYHFHGHMCIKSAPRHMDCLYKQNWVEK